MVGIDIAGDALAIAGKQIEPEKAAVDDAGARGIARFAKRGKQPAIGLACAGVAIPLKELGIAGEGRNAVGIVTYSLGQSGARIGHLGRRFQFRDLRGSVLGSESRRCECKHQTYENP